MDENTQIFLKLMRVKTNGFFCHETLLTVSAKTHIFGCCFLPHHQDAVAVAQPTLALSSTSQSIGDSQGRVAKAQILISHRCLDDFKQSVINDFN